MLHMSVGIDPCYHATSEREAIGGTYVDAVSQRI